MPRTREPFVATLVLGALVLGSLGVTYGAMRAKRSIVGARQALGDSLGSALAQFGNMVSIQVGRLDTLAPLREGSALVLDGAPVAVLVRAWRIRPDSARQGVATAFPQEFLDLLKQPEASTVFFAEWADSALPHTLGRSVAALRAPLDLALPVHMEIRPSTMRPAGRPAIFLLLPTGTLMPVFAPPGA